MDRFQVRELLDEIKHRPGEERVDQLLKELAWEIVYSKCVGKISEELEKQLIEIYDSVTTTCSDKASLSAAGQLLGFVKIIRCKRSFELSLARATA